MQAGTLAAIPNFAGVLALMGVEIPEEIRSGHTGPESNISAAYSSLAISVVKVEHLGANIIAVPANLTPPPPPAHHQTIVQR